MPATISQLKAHAIRPGQLKQADLGGGVDTPFEATFSSLAHQFVADKAPKLMDYEVGFQLVSKNNENTKAVGVFGFKVGPQWLYVPVFFLNGDLKGYELLYDKNKDQFIPLNEEWINYLLGRKPSILGEGLNRNLSLAGIMPPNLYQLARNPYKFASAKFAECHSPCEVCKHCGKSCSPEARSGGKCPNCGKDYIGVEEKGAAELPSMAGWFVEFLPNLSRLVLNDPNEKCANLRGWPDLLREAGPGFFRGFLEKLAAYPELKVSIDKLYGQDFLPGLARDIRAQRSLLSKMAAEEEDKPKDNKGPERKEDDQDPSKKIKVVTMDEVNEGGHPNILHGLSQDERQVLIKERIVVHDRRDDKEITLVYNVQTQLKLSTPTETGLYSVLIKPDQFELCLVVLSPYSHHGREPFCTVVSLDKPARWINIHPAHVFVQSACDRETFQKWFKKLPEADSLPGPKGRSWRNRRLDMLILPSGQATTPFSVVETFSKGSDDSLLYDVSFQCYADLKTPLPISNYPRDWRTAVNGCQHGSRIRLTGRPGKTIRSTEGVLEVPDTARILKLEPIEDHGPDGDDDADDRDPEYPGQSEPPPFEPGNLADVMTCIAGQTTPLKVYADGKDVSFNEAKKLNKLAALKTLVVSYGLREKAARAVLAEAEKLGRDRKPLELALVKQAQPPGSPIGDLQQSAPNSPPFPEPNIGYDPMTGANIPTMMPSVWNQRIPDMMAQSYNRDLYNPTLGDPRTMAVAQQAAQTGQKEVFDTSMLAPLLKLIRQESMVDRYLPDIMKGMDRLGRILFILYWHGEEFAERYGSEEMPELEDALRNAFESVGTILLELKKKTIDPNPDEGTNVDLGPLANQS
jgi:hypothetical protein